MHWILVLIVVLSLLVASWFNFKWGLGLLAGLALATIIFYYASGAGHFPGMGPSLDAADVGVENVTAKSAYANSYRVNMRIKNPSDALTIRDSVMRIQALDCATASSEDSACTIVAQIQKTVSMDVPPGQARDVVTVVAPPDFTPTGLVRWTARLESITAR